MKVCDQDKAFPPHILQNVQHNETYTFFICVWSLKNKNIYIRVSYTCFLKPEIVKKTLSDWAKPVTLLNSASKLHIRTAEKP